MNHFLLLLILFAPLLAAVGIAMGAPERKTAVWSGWVQIALALVLMVQLPSGGYAYVTEVPVFTLPEFFDINFIIGMDGINAPLVLLTALVACAAAAVVPASIQRSKEFHVMLMLIVFGATGAFISLDLFFLYIFHEVALIPTFLMIGIWGSRDRKFAATQMAIYLTLGSLVLLVGLLCLYFAFPPSLRSLDIRALQEALVQIGRPMDSGYQAGVLLFLLVGFGILVSLFPFHSWAPLGYASAPAPVAMLHAGVLKKFGLYGLLRLATPMLPVGIEQWSIVIQLLLLGNILWIGWVTLAQRDLDMMVGYSSVMHMGYLFLGFLSVSVIGTAGMLVLMVGHGLSAALLFATTAEIRERTGTVSFARLGGLAKKAPRLSLFFILGGLASIGLPGFANFAGEVLIFFGAWSHYPVATGVALFGVILSAVYMLRAVRSVCFGEVSEDVAQIHDLRPGVERWPYILLLTGLLCFGIFPGWIINMARPVIEAMIGG
ncbi:MAG: NuoM family protein [Candidatus Methylacidiphilales bacterium]